MWGFRLAYFLKGNIGIIPIFGVNPNMWGFRLVYFLGVLHCNGVGGVGGAWPRLTLSRGGMDNCGSDE